MLRRQTQKESEGRLKIWAGGGVWWDSLMRLRCRDGTQHSGEVSVLHRKGPPDPEMGRQGRRWTWL